MNEADASFAEKIKTGNVAAVREAVAADPELLCSVVDMDALPIPLAIYFGQRQVAEALREVKGTLSIHEACALGDLHEVQRNLQTDAQVLDSFSTDGFTPLCLASYMGHREIVETLIRAGAKPNIRSKNGLDVMPLHSALANGHKEIVLILIRAGADINAAAGGGWTPLHYVADSNDIDTARHLLERGADATLAREDGLTALQIARDKGHLDLAAMLEVSIKRF